MNRTLHSFFILTALIVLLFGCSTKRTDIVEVRFTNQLTQVDLDKVQENLTAQDITLTYTLIEFDEQGYLKKISASIEYSDGKKGSFESRELQQGDNPGFRRDFSKN